MFKRTVLLIALIALLVAVAPSAQSASRHRLDQTAKLSTVEGSIATGGVSAGIVRGRPGGTGAVLLRFRTQGTTSTARGTVYYRRGRVTVTSTITGTPQPDGTISFTGTGRVRDGTGAFRNAHGRFNITGSANPSANQATFELDGNVTY